MKIKRNIPGSTRRKVEYKTSKFKCKRILKENGVGDSSLSRIPELKTKDLLSLKELIEGNKVKPVIDRIYLMAEIVDAHSYVDKGHKKGNVVIRIDIST